tara:strand:+ start:31200 stop:32672 length:1473 start_codon:yes stop_codon:yes gene_type:complete
LSITIPENLDNLDQKIQSRLEKCRAGILCPDTLKEQALKLRESMGWTHDCGLLIAAGHQPVLYHPGLLMKDVLAHALAKRYNGVAYNIVLDTDEVDLEFSYPALMDLDYSSTVTGTAAWPVQKRTARYGNSRRIVGSVEFTQTDRMRLLQACDDACRGLHLVLNPASRESARRMIQDFKRSIETAESILDPSTELRRLAHEKLGIQIRDVRASDLFDSEAFLYFATFIAERSDDFRSRYNLELARYRRERKIKNLAQPLPDLDEASGELPFWYIENGIREPLQDEGFQEAIESARAGKGKIYPRAITTSLFFRLFFCDLFIHGTGGGRYDRITENLISEFFQCDAAPFLVATASLSMQPRADLPVESRTVPEVELEMREIKFDPAQFLSTECKLRKERDDLIQQWQVARKKGQDRSELHGQFLKLRKKAGLYLKGQKKDLRKERARARYVDRARKIYGDRSYPIFYYDLSPLLSAVQNIASPQKPEKVPG